MSEWQMWVFLPPVNHLIALFEPTDTRHLATWRSSVHVDDHVVLSHQHLQAVHYIPTFICKEEFVGALDHLKWNLIYRATLISRDPNMIR